MTVERNAESLNLAPASLDDFRDLARRRLPRIIFDNLDGGSFNEVTLRANRQDFDDIRFRQRVLQDVSRRNLATSVLGQELALPLILAPLGNGGLFARRAEVQAARSAERAGIPFCEATLAICGIEEVAAAVRQPIWFQLYMMKDRDYVQDLMARAEQTGCTTLVFTVDMPFGGMRYRDVRNGINGGLGVAKRLRREIDLVSHVHWVSDVVIGGRPLTFGNLEKAVPGARKPQDFFGWIENQFDSSFTWADLSWLRKNWKGMIVLKGILDTDDAREAVHRGIDAIVVSNHGGRQLDDVPSSIASLPAIVDAVGGQCEVLMDGGVRSGLDVVKALALGARACLIGRPWAYAVAAQGEAGIDRILSVIREEMLITLGLIGVTDVEKLDSSVLL
jgi:L-lactate dehydrogenase (cytochrome)